MAAPSARIPTPTWRDRWVTLSETTTGVPFPITIICITVEFQTNVGKGRILALDLGKKRIGLALSDPLGITAQGLPTLQRTTIRADLTALEDLIREHGVKVILMGHPLHMSGRESRQSEY